MSDTITTVSDYLNSLAPDRRVAIEELRALILANLPEGYVETYNWRMLSYEVPLAVNPNTYNGQPLMYVALGSNKNNLVLHLCSLYNLPGAYESFLSAWQCKKKPDLGKACLRFKAIADIDLPLIANTIAAIPVADFISGSEANRNNK